MSVPQVQPPNPSGSPALQRSGCATVIMVAVGVALLFPGLCFMVVVSAVPGHIGREELVLLLVCGIVAVSGIALIVWAFLRP